MPGLNYYQMLGVIVPFGNMSVRSAVGSVIMWIRKEADCFYFRGKSTRGRLNSKFLIAPKFIMQSFRDRNIFRRFLVLVFRRKIDG